MNEKKDIPQLNNIVYISVPVEMNTDLDGFQIDPTILLPVEIPPGDEELFLENLSWEMIIAAMLKIVAFNPENENIDYYREFILHVKPDIIDELTYTGIVKAKNKDFTVAEEIFLALSNLLPNFLQTRINLALVYEERAEAYTVAEREDFAETYRKKAINSYNSIFEADETFPEAHLNAGYFYLKLEGYTKAKHHFEMYQQYGKDRRKLDEVQSILTKISTRSTQDHLFKEAYDYIKLGKEEEGINRIKEFLDSDPAVSNAWFLLGWAFRRLGKYQDGRDAFFKALQLDKPHCDVLNELAICLMELGEYKESRKHLNDALRLEPENVKIISNMGILALKEDKKEEALDFFKIVLEIDPEDTIAKKYIDFLS